MNLCLWLVRRSDAQSSHPIQPDPLFRASETVSMWRTSPCQKTAVLPIGLSSRSSPRFYCRFSNLISRTFPLLTLSNQCRTTLVSKHRRPPPQPSHKKHPPHPPIQSTRNSPHHQHRQRAAPQTPATNVSTSIPRKPAQTSQNTLISSPRTTKTFSRGVGSIPAPLYGAVLSKASTGHNAGSGGSSDRSFTKKKSKKDGCSLIIYNKTIGPTSHRTLLLRAHTMRLLTHLHKTHHPNP